MSTLSSLFFQNNTSTDMIAWSKVDKTGAIASDIGAVALAGATMTGSLIAKANDSSTDRVYNIHVGTQAPADTSVLWIDTN